MNQFLHYQNENNKTPPQFLQLMAKQQQLDFTRSDLIPSFK